MQNRKAHYIALDIDETVVNGHIHNTISNYKQALEREIEQINKDIEEKSGFESMEIARATIEEMNQPIAEEIAQLDKSPDPDSKTEIMLLKEELVDTSDAFIRQEVEEAQKLLPEYKAKLEEAEQHLQAISNEAKAQYELIKHLEPVGKKEDWQAMREEARAAGFELAGLSYGSFPGATEIWLQEKLGFECEIVSHNRDQKPIELDPDKMTLISYLPVFFDQRKYGKNKHIEQFLKAKGADKDPDITMRLCLIDDSQNNVSRASSKGYKTILAKPKQDRHIQQVRDHITKIKQLTQPSILNQASDALPLATNTSSMFSKKDQTKKHTTPGEQVIPRPQNK